MIVKISHDRDRFLINGKKWESLTDIEQNFIYTFHLETTLAIEKNDIRLSEKWAAEVVNETKTKTTKPYNFKRPRGKRGCYRTKTNYFEILDEPLNN